MQTIEITTTQNVTIEYELAGLRERFFGQLVDSIVMLFLWIALSFIARSLDLYQSEFITQMVITFPFWFFVFYGLICEAFLNGQTIGKKTQRTRVVRIDGKPTSFSDLLLRSVLLLADYPFSVGVIGALLISTSEKRQRLGDMAAGTTVIKLGTDRRFRLLDILNISTLDNYTPQYAQVKQLSEEDMLLIKNVIIRYQRYGNYAHYEAVNELFEHLIKVLNITVKADTPQSKIDFLKMLIKDYIVLTR
jgi:uncharacterized RDD family membrane protein YckC